MRKLIYICILLVFSFALVVNATQYIEFNQSNFSNGTYNNTIYNTTYSAIVLSGTNTSGNYTSQVINTNFSHFNNISWTADSLMSLPDSASQTGWINMSRNRLLLHLNETSGNLTDFSGTVSHAQTNVAGAITYSQQGIFNSSLYFNPSAASSANYIFNSTSSTITGDQNRTISFWEKDVGMTGDKVMIMLGYGTSCTANGHFAISPQASTWAIYGCTGTYDETINVNRSVIDGNWHNIVVTYANNSKVINAYSDGQLIGTFTRGGAEAYNTRVGYKFGQFADNNRAFNGYLDEISVWDRVLSSSEVSTIYSAGAARLNLSVRSCDDSACSGESFSYVNVSSPQTLNISNNSYFQYKFEFINGSSIFPKLYNITLDYTTLQISYGSGVELNDSFFNRNWIFANVSINLANESNITFNLYNSTSLVNSTFSSSGLRTVNWTNLTEGRYYYNVTVSNNLASSYSTETRTIVLDRTNPNATLISPANGSVSNSTNNSYVVNLTDNISVKNATLNIINKSNGSIVNQTTTTFNESTSNNLLTTVVDTVEGIFDWFYNIFDWAGNNYATENRTLTVDASGPLIDYDSGTLASDSSIDYNYLYVDVIASDLTEENITFYLYDSNGLVNATTFTDSTRNINFTLPSEGRYYYNVTIFDSTGRSNSTSTRNVIYDGSSFNVSITNPTSGATLWNNYLNNISVNVTCLVGNCTNLNVSLYSESLDSSPGEDILSMGSLPVSLQSGSYGGSPNWGASETVDALYDNDVNTYTGLQGVNDQYLINTFDTEISVQDISIIWHAGGCSAGPGNYYFQYWDGADWISPSEWDSLGSNQDFDTEYVYSLGSPVSTSQVRLFRPNVGGCGGIGVSEWHVAGERNNDFVLHISGRPNPGTSWGATNDKSVLYDLDANTYFGLHGNSNQYVEYVFNESKSIDKVTVSWRSGSGSAPPGNYYFEYWDGAGWVAPSEWDSLGSNQDFDTEYVYSLGSPVSTSQVRLFRPTYGGGGGIGLEEFRVTTAAVVGAGASLVSDIAGTAPFYINDTNSRIINLSEGQTATITYWLNVTDTSGNYQFYAIANRTVSGLNNISENVSASLQQDSISPSLGLGYSPNYYGDVDPGTNISFTAQVNDSGIGVDKVILEYNNGSDWTNGTMTSIGGNDYQFNLTTISNEVNYTVRVYANDSSGNANISEDISIASRWDCTWNISNNYSNTLSGYDELSYLGTLMINNTGDPQYSNNNCTLSFVVKHNLGPSNVSSPTRIKFASQSNYLFVSQYSGLPAVSAKNNLSVPIYVKFSNPSGVLSENLIVNTTEPLAISDTSLKQSQATLVTGAGGPYLSSEISSYPTKINMTNGKKSLEGYVRNLLGDGSLNNTAFNVSLNWSFNSSFIVREGNMNKSFSNISNYSLFYNKLNITFNETNLPSLSPGDYVISLYAQGYDNLTGNLSLINHADNITLLVKQVNITLQCYNVSDGISVPACGSLDGDYVAPVVTSSSSSSGGGGGGGGASTIQTKADYTIVRGKQNEIVVPFSNKYSNESLKGLRFSVSGNIAKYISVEPATLDRLDAGQTKYITLKITSPTYIELGQQKITLKIEGQLGVNSYSENKIIILQVNALPIDEAQTLLSESRQLIDKLKGINLSSEKLNLLLNESNKAFNNLEYEKIESNYDTIKKEVDYAIEANDILLQLNELIINSNERGIDTSKTQRLLKLTKLSLERGEYEEAHSRAKEAQVAFALEVKGEVAKISYYLKNYPGQIAGATVFAVIFSFGAYKVTRYGRLKSRMKKLRAEEELIINLIKTVQNDTFKGRKMDMEEYRASMLQYEKRLARIVEELIDVETEVTHAFSFVGTQKKLLLEKGRLLELMRQVQTDYLKNRTIESKAYELKLESYTKRLAEVDQKLATLEAKEAMKRFKL